MSWPTGPLWADALSGPHQLRWIVSAVRGDQLLADGLEVDRVRLQATWDGHQVSREFSCEVYDPDGSLLNSSPASPLAPWGQQMIVRAELAVGSAWSQSIPVGVFRIEETGNDPSTAVLQRNGAWLFAGQTLRPTGRDMLQQLADERWTTVVGPQSPETVTHALGRIVAGTSIPMGRVTAPQPVPSTTAWGQTKLDAAVAVAEIAGAAVWCDRTGALSLIDSEEGSGQVWTVSPDQAWVTWAVAASRTGVVNGVSVTAVDDSGRWPIRGSAYARSGPLAWGGPFGRVAEVEADSTVHSNATANAAAAKKLARAVASRTAQVAITAPADPSLDVLDLVEITTDRGPVTGLIQSIEISEDTMKVSAQVSWEQVWHD